MRTKINKKLLKYLPDYIEGNIEDSDLKEKINSELYKNIYFRQEYEFLLQTLNLMKDSRYLEPPSGYFNSLLPKIVKKLNSEKEYRHKKYFFLSYRYLKYLLPVIPVILIFLIYRNFFTNFNNETKIFDTLKTNQENINITKEQNHITSADTISNIAKDDYKSSDKESSIEPLRKNKIHKGSEVANKIEEPNQAEEYLIQQGFALEESDDNDFDYEINIENIDTETQNDLLKKLESTNF